MKSTIFMLAAIIALLCLYWHIAHSPPAHIAPAHIKQLMRYHGAQVLYEQHDGQFYFIRDGKKIFVRVSNG